MERCRKEIGRVVNVLEVSGRARRGGGKIWERLKKLTGGGVERKVGAEERE